MATLVLQAVGATLGSAFGPVGSAIGSAIGSAAGYAIDSALINSTRHIEGARLSGARPMSAEEGTPITRVYGYARVPGTLIWATELEEVRKTERQGAKGGPKVTTYNYYGNMAVGLCEGKIGGIKRIWADGKELNLEDINFTFYDGDESQNPSPLIEAKQGIGNAPAYRGLAYIVFEKLPLDRFGNRLPQIQVEVIRPVGALEDSIQAISIIPGATEHGLDPLPVTAKIGRDTIDLNRHQMIADTDWCASIDELQIVCPNLRHASIVVAWYGNDLRADQTQIKPGIVSRERNKESTNWKVSGLSRESDETHIVSTSNGAAAFGGTPSDVSVVRAIEDLKYRGLKVTLNPFLLMDIPHDNDLENPDGVGYQPAYPWRGRITCSPGIGQPDTVDQTALAAPQIDAFIGNSQPSSLIDFGYRRMILHYAELSVLAGGVDTIIIGSELIGLTRIRDAENVFPFVQALKALAQDVRSIVGPDCNILYGADWSEYFGYHPQDGSADVFFNLDDLWSDDNIDAVGIDNYMPLSDWREADRGPDGANRDGATWPSDKAAFKAAIEGAEGYDWYYASDDDRALGLRTEISDGAYNKPWVFRYKDIRSWWSNEHFNRIDGFEMDNPTHWIPQSKPIWFLEIGCPSVDLGAREPNAFVDLKSAEGRFPTGSIGVRDDTEQRNFLASHHEYWGEEQSSNPVSAVYGAPMVATDRMYCWAWDARPYPVFPLNLPLWADGTNWSLGHWLNGKLGTAPVADVMNRVFLDHGLTSPVIEDVSGSLTGVLVAAPSSVRAAIEPLSILCGVEASDDIATTDIRIFGTQAYQVTSLAKDDLAERSGEPLISTKRLQTDELPSEVTLNFRDAQDNYRTATCYSRRIEGTGSHQLVFDAPANIEIENAQALSELVLSKLWNGKTTISFSLPQDFASLKAGDVFAFSDKPLRHWQVTRTSVGNTIDVEARSIQKAARSKYRHSIAIDQSLSNAAQGYFGGAPQTVTMDLPRYLNSSGENVLHIASLASAREPQLVFVSPTEDGFILADTIAGNATLGRLSRSVSGSVVGRIDYGTQLDVSLDHGEFESVQQLLLLAGRNLLAVQSATGVWEVLQFMQAEELAQNHWRLTKLLRGQGGTEDAMRIGANEGAQVVLLNEAVGKIALSGDQIGLENNFRIGPTGKEFSDRFFTNVRAAGGARGLMPLSPVHITAKRNAQSGVLVQWIRRSRTNADDWQQLDVPLDEEVEIYRFEVLNGQGASIFNTTVTKPECTIPQNDLETLFGQFPQQMSVRICQVSQRIGDGVKAETTVKVHH